MLLSESLLILYREYIANNYILYLVGGAVRDSLLSLIPKDYDFVTDANIEQSVSILQKLGYSYNVDEYHGVIKIKSLNVEITRFRKDLERGFQFNVSIEDDANRRDLTYNAIYYDISNQRYLDFHNGVGDLNNKLIRMIGNPEQRIREDKTRILRILKYAARYDHRIDFDMTNDLSGISEEIIANEIVDGNNQYFKLLDDFNLYPSVFPKLIVNFCEIETRYIEIRLACLLQNNVDIEEKLKLLKYGRKLSETVAFLIELINFDVNKLNYYLVKRNKIDLEILKEWIAVMKLGEYQHKFLTFKSPITKIMVDELVKLGYNGDKLSEKLSEINKNDFLNVD